MGLVRGGLLVLVSVVFFIGLLFANLLGTVYSSLDYDDVKPQVSDVVKGYFAEQIPGNFSDAGFSMLNKSCLMSSYYVINNSITNTPLNISCKSINQGQEAVIQEVINETFDGIYYENYSCAPLKCLEEQNKPFYFISKEFQDYVGKRFYILFFALVVAFILIFILAESKSNAFFIVGILLIISSLPFITLKSFVPKINESLSLIFGIFFSAARNIFIDVLILGIVFVLVGIALKFFNIGFKISNFIGKFKKTSPEEKESASKEEVKKEIKEAVKQEVAKSKAQPSDKSKNIKKNKS